MGERDEPSGDGGRGATSVAEVVARLERLPFTRSHLKIGAILCGGTFFDAFDALAIASALTVIFKVLHISLVNVGLLLGVGYIGQFLGAVCVGALSERYGRKAGFTISIAVYAIFTLATALAWNFASLTIFRVLQGFGLGAEVPMGAALFSEFLASRRRGVIYMTYQTIFGWGVLLAPLVVAAVLAVAGPGIGWRIALGIGVIPVIIAVIAWRALPESPRWLVEQGRGGVANDVVTQLERAATRRGRALAPVRVEVATPTRGTDLRELFSAGYLRRTVLVWVMFATSYFISYSYTIWLPTLYVQFGHLPVGEALILTSVVGAVSIVVGYIFALLVDSVGRLPIFIACFAIMAFGAAFGVFLVLGLKLTAWPVLFAVTLIITVGTYPVNTGLYLYTPELFPTRMRAWATGTGSGMQRIFTAIAPFVVGLIVASASGAGAAISGVFILLLVVALIGLVTVVVLGVETTKRVLEHLEVSGDAPTRATLG